MPSRQRLILLALLLLSLFVVVACGEEEQPTPEATPRVITLPGDNSPMPTPATGVSMLPTPIPFQFPTDLSAVKVDPGKAVVLGRLISTVTGQPIANTPVRMAEIFYAEEGNKDPNQGAWALDNAQSPFAYTNADGFFIFENVEPGDFVIFVGDVLDRYNVETNENERPVPRTAPADELSDLGDVRVNY